MSPRSAIPFSPPFLDFVKRIPPTLILHVASLTFSVVTFSSKRSVFSPDYCRVHPVTTILAMIVINTNFFIVILILYYLQLSCELFTVAKLNRFIRYMQY